MPATRFETQPGSWLSSTASSSGRGSAVQVGELAFTIQPQWCGIGAHGAFASVSLPASGHRRPGTSMLAWLGRRKAPTDAKFLQWLEAAKSGEQPASSTSKVASEPRAPVRPDPWYAECCVFCASCKESINDSTRDKSGVCCQGCRRWFHNRCRKQLPPLPPLSPGEQQSGAYFHCGECRRLYGVLAGSAAQGDIAVANGRSLRLLELAAVRQELEGRAASGSPPTDAQIQRAWGAAPGEDNGSNGGSHGAGGGDLSHAGGTSGAAAAASSAGTAGDGQQGASSASVAQAQQQAQQVAPGALQPLHKGRRHRAPSGLETFLAVSQLLNRGHFEEPVEELMDDAFGVALRHKGQLVCAATFNLHAPDHARVQSMVTDPSVRRQGHAAALLGELQRVLSSAGVEKLVVVLDEGAPEDVKAAQRLLRRKCGFMDVSPQQLVQWRKELPEYHKQLLGNATLLVKQLVPSGSF